VPDTFSIRTDPELNAALEYLGVTTDARNRSAVIKEAVMMAAQVKRDMDEADTIPEPILTRIPNPGSTDATYLLTLRGQQP
jgi:predicted transcriptional regulator